MSDHLYRHFYPYMFHKMKCHLDTIDYDNPRDFMDIMLIEAADPKSSIGYNTITMTIMGLVNMFVVLNEPVNQNQSLHWWWRYRFEYDPLVTADHCQASRVAGEMLRRIVERGE